MQDLNLQTTLPALSFDAEALKAWAMALTEKYTGLVVTDDAVSAAKKDMAELNKTRKTLDDARKETVRQISAPIKDFEDQIKEVCGIFDTAYQGLAQQVKAFEEKERDDKRKLIEAILVDANKSAFGESAKLTIPIQDKWLNKATTIKSIRADVAAIIERHQEEEQRRKALEQARQERVAVIEQAVVAANARHSVALTISAFMTARFMSLETPLAEALSTIEENAKRLAQAAQNKPAPDPHIVHASTAASYVAPQVAPVTTCAGQDKCLSVIMTFSPANEAAVSLLLNQIKPLCASFSARSR